MKFKNFKLSCLFLMFGANCLAQSGVTIIDSILSDNIYRKYRLYVPNIYNNTQATPLILNLHGYTSNSIEQQMYSNFMPIADTANFIMVYPDGMAPAGSQYWNAGFGGSEKDVLFMSDLIDSLILTYNIDLNSVYSCGMSNGGIMSYYLACNLPNRIAAIASVTGSMLNTWYTCSPSRPFPVMEIHGTADPTVNYNGNVIFTPIDNVISKWVTNNNCNTTPTTYSVPNINLTDNSYAVNYKYSGGSNGSSVELYKIFGGGHAWPGAIPIKPNTNQDFNASVEIWRFFRKYKLNQFISNVSVAENYLTPNVKVFPNPASDKLFVDGIINDKLQIETILGEVVLKDITSNVIDIGGLSSGVYFIKINTETKKFTLKFIKS